MKPIKVQRGTKLRIESDYFRDLGFDHVTGFVLWSSNCSDYLSVRCIETSQIETIFKKESNIKQACKEIYHPFISA